MILAALTMALVAPVGQQVPGDPPGDAAALAEQRATLRMAAADAAAARGIPETVAGAPKRGEVPPRNLYMPILDELYPPSALRAEQQGLVRLRCMLTVKGRLEGCEMAFPSGVPALDRAAFEVATFTRYSPWIVDRVPQARRVILPVRWVIAD